MHLRAKQNDAMSTIRASAEARFADRVGALGTENAFKIGPKIRSIEEQGKKAREIRFGAKDGDNVYARVGKVEATFALAPSKVQPLLEAVR